MNIYWDIETYSQCNLKDYGAHRYATDPSTGIYFFCFACDDGGADATAAGGGAGGVDDVDNVDDDVAGVVGVGVGVGVDVDGPLICGVGDGGTGWKRPGDRQSPVGCKCGRICIPYFADFHGRFSRCTIGYTCSPRSMRITAIASSKFV